MYTELKTGARLLPPELTVQDFVCTAFPQPTLGGRLWVAIYMVIVLFPIQTFYTMGFQGAGNARKAGAPAFMVAKPEGPPKPAGGMGAANKQFFQVGPLPAHSCRARGFARTGGNAWPFHVPHLGRFRVKHVKHALFKVVLESRTVLPGVVLKHCTSI